MIKYIKQLVSKIKKDFIEWCVTKIDIDLGFLSISTNNATILLIIDWLIFIYCVITLILKYLN